MNLTEWSKRIHEWAHGKGFWGTACTPPICRHKSGGVLSCLMLVVTEVGEAVEAYRCGDIKNFKEEIADSIIRLLDLAGGAGIDIEDEVAKKMAINENRPYLHGKSC